ncbi:MAG: RNA-binding protein [Terrimicrobiaceae bacterium]|nr:RNA-binding protein [Terrimicrobiaceae bacterium]
MSTKLYVGNLSFDTNESDLRSAFAAAGNVTDVAVVQDKMTGRSRGFAFVTMSSAEEAQAAISQFHGKDFDGRNLTVNEARPREDFGPNAPRKSFGGGNKPGGGGDRRPARRY